MHIARGARTLASYCSSWTGRAERALRACAAGVYNEQVFKAMDFVLDQASRHGMRAIVALTDYWKVTDGVQQVMPHGPLGSHAKQPRLQAFHLSASNPNSWQIRLNLRLECIWSLAWKVILLRSRKGSRHITPLTCAGSQYVNWCNGGSKDAFFTNDGCHQLFKNHIRHFVNRCLQQLLFCNSRGQKLGCRGNYCRLSC